MAPTNTPLRNRGVALARVSRPCRVIVDGIRDGATNLAVDELLLHRVSQEFATTETYLRFYTWTQPTLSLGLAQRASRVLDFDFCRNHGIRIVRRATGGKAVLHHHEVTYAVISNDRSLFPVWSIGETYRAIAGALRRGLRLLGIHTTLADSANRHGRKTQSNRSNACFAISQQHEILSAGRKLVGSAQRRTVRGFLQHGSILMDFDLHLLRGALRGQTPTNLASNVATVKSCLGQVPDVAAFTTCLLDGFRRSLPVRIEPTPLDPQIRSAAEALGKTRVVPPPREQLGL